MDSVQQKVHLQNFNRILIFEQDVQELVGTSCPEISEQPAPLLPVVPEKKMTDN